jgi:ATP-dependent helicase/nuclease subunit A
MRYFAQPDSDLRAAEFLRSRFVRISDPAIVALAPGFAAALTGAAPSYQILERLDPGDRALLDLARRDVARWLGLLDRVTPGELVDTVLRESFYAYELRGRRFDQARENVKKVRSLIRRVESRGYATLGRIAEYFETLRAGDESNAIIDAAGAVNLMTMHAAKGLEFPIVFLVNLHMQGRGRGGNISIVERGVDDEPEVAFSSTDGTRLEDLRESEELRRLLYVAATRARDRLYLAAELDPRGQVRRGPRSLASLLPKSLLDVFANSVAARASGDHVTWAAGRGTFAFSICRPGSPVVTPAEEEAASLFTEPPWLVSPHRKTTPGVVKAALTTPGVVFLVGTLVHRLMQRQLPAGTDEAAIRTLAGQLVRRDERADVAGLSDLLDQAVALYSRLRDRDDLRTALAAGEVHFEVPFSHAHEERPGETVRGVIDCLIVPADGPPIVLEFKTGRPAPEHDAQVALYRDAARRLLGVSHVETRILYA